MQKKTDYSNEKLYRQQKHLQNEKKKREKWEEK